MELVETGCKRRHQRSSFYTGHFKQWGDGVGARGRISILSPIKPLILDFVKMRLVRGGNLKDIISIPVYEMVLKMKINS